MPKRNNYWINRPGSGRLSRRRFMGGLAGAGTGAAGLTLVGCGNDDDEPSPTPTDDNGNGNGAPEPTPANGNGNGNGQPRQGGVRRVSSSDATFDTFDADRSRFTPFAAMLGYSHLGIVHYRSFENGGELEGALAESWEEPDDLTLTFRLRPGVRWHNKPPLDGRETTVEDLQFFIERNRDGVLLDGTEDASFWRQLQFSFVESVEVTDDQTLTVTFSQPNPFFLGTLANSYAKVQAREIIEEYEDQMRDLPVEALVGTGAFMLESFDPEGRAEWVRNPDFYEDVNFDGVEWVPLFADTAARESSFLQKDIDELGGIDLGRLNQHLDDYEGEMHNTPAFSANPIAGTYYGGAPPWNDQRLIGAIFRTLDRRLLMEQFVQGSGALSGNIPPTQIGWGIQQEELITYPGYLEDREEDLAEARAMWDAADGEELGEIIVDIPDIFEGLYGGAAEIITDMLQGNLGNEFTASIETYATINGKIPDQAYGNENNNIWFGWITDVSDLEPTIGLWQNYNSEAPAFFQFGVEIPEVDDLTNEAMVEFDEERRMELSQEIERHLLENYGAGIPYNFLQITNTLRWNYYHVGEEPPFPNTHNVYRDHWFDMDDPTWEGRS